MPRGGWDHWSQGRRFLTCFASTEVAQGMREAERCLARGLAGRSCHYSEILLNSLNCLVDTASRRVHTTLPLEVSQLLAGSRRRSASRERAARSAASAGMTAGSDMPVGHGVHPYPLGAGWVPWPKTEEPWVISVRFLVYQAVNRPFSVHAIYAILPPELMRNAGALAGYTGAGGPFRTAGKWKFSNKRDAGAFTES